MIRWLIVSGMKFRLLVVAAAAILLLFASFKVKDMPKGVYPEFSPVFVEVQTEALGLSADEVEQLLTVAIEQDLLNGIAYLDEIWSQSLPGLSRIVLIFQPGTDPFVARQVVAERLVSAYTLPKVATPPTILQPTSTVGRVMKIGLFPDSEDMSLVDLSVLARWNIQPHLMGVEGVANVSIWGQRKRQLQVQVDPISLKQKGVSLSEVIKTTGEALWVSPLTYLESSTPGTGGFLDTPNQRLGVRHVLPITSPEELAEVSLDGHPDMILGDVSNVIENHQPLIGNALVNGNSALMLVIEKFPWASTSEVTENVKAAIAEIQPGLTGVAMDTEIFQPARYLNAALGNLSTMLGMGILLAVAIVFLFFRDLKASVISAIGIVLPLLAATYILSVYNVMLDMMSIAGLILAAGLILTDVVFSVDNIRNKISRLDEGVNNVNSIGTAVLNATLQTRSPLMFSMSILLLIVVPLIFVEGILGAFLQPFVWAFTYSILAALLLSLFLVPALCMLFYAGGNVVYRELSFISSLRDGLTSSVASTMNRPSLVYGLCGVLLVLGIGTQFMTKHDIAPPDLKERDLLIEWKAAPGTSQQEMNRIMTQVMTALHTVPGVQNTAAHNGRAILGDKIMNVNGGEIWLSLSDEVNYEEALNNVRTVLDEYPGIKKEMLTYHSQILNENLRLANHKYGVRIYGEIQDVLKKETEKLHDEMNKISGIGDLKIHYPEMEPTIEILVDLEAVKQHNLKPGDVRRATTALVSGLEVGSLFEGQKVFSVVVWGDENLRSSTSSIEDILVNKPDGTHIRLGDVAHVRVKPNPASINREAVSRYMDISFSPGSLSESAAIAAVKKSISAVNFPSEFHAHLVGTYKEDARRWQSNMGILIAIGIGILLLLQAIFFSWSLLTAIFVGMLVPALVAGIGIFINGQPFSIGPLLGVLVAFGFTAYHTILLVSHFKYLEFYENKTFGAELISQGVQERFIPMVIAALATFCFFLPFAIAGAIPGLEIINGMAIAMTVGIVASLLFCLWVVPTIYLQFGLLSEPVKEEEKSLMEISQNGAGPLQVAYQD